MKTRDELLEEISRIMRRLGFETMDAAQNLPNRRNTLGDRVPIAIQTYQHLAAACWHSVKSAHGSVATTSQVWKFAASMRPLHFLPTGNDQLQYLGRVLAEAIREVHAGKTHLLPEIADRLARLSLKGISSPLELLTEREMKVFELMARGLTNEEMAKEFGITARAISVNSQSVKSKLGVERNADITLLAVKHKVIQL